jgi:hypothetical protein
MKLTLKSGGVKVIDDSFFSFVVTQRSPYSGTLTSDEMWVSFITEAGFPGFRRMMDAFTPPMELISGLCNLYEQHYLITKFEFDQDPHSKNGQIGVCLDGDPMDGGSSITVLQETKAWRIMADAEYPAMIAPEHIKCGPTTPLAKQWLEANPAPEGAWVQQPNTKEGSASAQYIKQQTAAAAKGTALAAKKTARKASAGAKARIQKSEDLMIARLEKRLEQRANADQQSSDEHGNQRGDDQQSSDEHGKQRGVADYAQANLLAALKRRQKARPGAIDKVSEDIEFAIKQKQKEMLSPKTDT